MLQTFSMEKFLELLRRDLIKVDFDARSGFGRVGHNHGTKFRMQSHLLSSLYETVTTIVDKPLDYSERLKHINLTTIRSTEAIIQAINEGPTYLDYPK